MPPSPPTPATTALLQLYRRILKNAKVFPSVKRDRMIKDIREEFRINARETDPEKIRQYRETAIRGLSQLQAYTGLVDTDMDWTVTMEQTPLGGLSEEKMEARMKRVPQAAVGRGDDEKEGEGKER